MIMLCSYYILTQGHSDVIMGDNSFSQSIFLSRKITITINYNIEEIYLDLRPTQHRTCKNIELFSELFEILMY